MKLDLKEWVNKVTDSIKARTILTKNYQFSNLAQYSPSGYYFYITGVKAKAGIPSTATLLSASMSAWAGLGTTPNVNLADNDSICVTFQSGASVTSSSYITVRFAYVVGGVVRKLLKALKPLTLGRGWAV